MNVLIIYDSVYGQTERVAQAIAGVMAERGSVRVVKASALGTFELKGADVLLLGGPTHVHGVSQTMKKLVDSIPKDSLRGIEVAVFDTRYRMNPLLSGSAASALAGRLRKLGGRLLVPPESFFVKDTKNLPAEGTQDAGQELSSKERRKQAKLLGRTSNLEDGELDRSVQWARMVLAKIA